MPEFIPFCVICDIRKDRFGLFPILNFFLFSLKKVIALNSILMLASFGEGIAYAVFAGQMNFVDKLIFSQEVFIASSVFVFF